MGLPKPHYRAGDAGRQVPHHRLGGEVALFVEEHVTGGGERRLLAVVEGGRRPVGHSHQHEAATADVARLWIDDREGQRHRDRGIDGVPTGTHDFDADVAGVDVRAHHHAVLCCHGRGIGLIAKLAIERGRFVRGLTGRVSL